MSQTLAGMSHSAGPLKFARRRTWRSLTKSRVQENLVNCRQCRRRRPVVRFHHHPNYIEGWHDDGDQSRRRFEDRDTQDLKSKLQAPKSTVRPAEAAHQSPHNPSTPRDRRSPRSMRKRQRRYETAWAKYLNVPVESGLDRNEVHAHPARRVPDGEPRSTGRSARRQGRQENERTSAAPTSTRSIASCSRGRFGWARRRSRWPVQEICRGHGLSNRSRES